MPEVSVVVPLYNKSPYIARALNSVLDQTFQDFEIIVVDDGSTDDGAEVVGEFHDTRIWLIQQDNQGVSMARNRGIEEAKAEFVAFLDADDEWLPKHLETLLRLRERYPKAGAYGTAYLIKVEGLTAKVAQFSGNIPPEPWEGIIPNYFKVVALGEHLISASTVAIPKCVLKEMGGFTTDAWWGEDIDLWGRIALKYPIAFSWDGMGIYHTEASNRACNSSEPVEEVIFVRTAWEAIKADKVQPEFKDDLLEYVAYKLINSAWQNIRAGRPDIAQNNLKKCITKKLLKEKYWTMIWAYMPPKVYYLFRNVKNGSVDILKSVSPYFQKFFK